MHSSTGLAIPAGFVVLCRFWAGAVAPAPGFPFPSAVTEPPANLGPVGPVTGVGEGAGESREPL
jgi:hypothetical protein